MASITCSSSERGQLSLVEFIFQLIKFTFRCRKRFKSHTVKRKPDQENITQTSSFLKWEPSQNNTAVLSLEGKAMFQLLLLKQANCHFHLCHCAYSQSCWARSWHCLSVSPSKAQHAIAITPQVTRFHYHCKGNWIFSLHQSFAPWNVSHLLVHLSHSSGRLIFRQQCEQWPMNNADVTLLLGDYFASDIVTSLIFYDYKQIEKKIPTFLCPLKEVIQMNIFWCTAPIYNILNFQNAQLLFIFYLFCILLSSININFYY